MIKAELPVPAFFTTRFGGYSSEPYDSLNLALNTGDNAATVLQNRQVITDMFDLPLVVMQAEHGVRVVDAHEAVATGDLNPACDVLIARDRSVALMVLAADCVPILIHDASTGAVAAVHAGRQGLYKGVIDAAVSALIDLRGGWHNSPSLSATIGPAICGQCYEVPTELQSQVAMRHPTARSTTSWKTPALDLPRAAEVRLMQLGFTQISRIRQCTYESPELFSFRRDGQTGRQGAVIACA